jgi:hypothetical protein
VRLIYCNSEAMIEVGWFVVTPTIGVRILSILVTHFLVSIMCTNAL